MTLLGKIKSVFKVKKKDNFDLYMEKLGERASEKIDGDIQEFLEIASYQDRMKLLAEEAKEDYGIEVRPDSLKVLDNEFEKLEQQYPNQNPIKPTSKEELNRIIEENPERFQYNRELGKLRGVSEAILGEIIIENFGGEWTEQDLTGSVNSDKFDIEGVVTGVKIPINETDYNFVNIPNLVNKRVEGTETLHDIYLSIKDMAEGRDTKRHRQIYDENNFDMLDLRDKARELSEDLDLKYDLDGLKKLDEAVNAVDIESDIEDIDNFILEVGCFFGMVLEKELDIQIQTENGDFIVYVPGTDTSMNLMHAAEIFVREEEKSLVDTFRFFKDA